VSLFGITEREHQAYSLLRQAEKLPESAVELTESTTADVCNQSIKYSAVTLVQVQPEVKEHTE